MPGCARAALAFALALLGSFGGSLSLCTYAEHKAPWPHWADFICGHNAPLLWIVSVPVLFGLCFCLIDVAAPRSVSNKGAKHDPKP